MPFSHTLVEIWLFMNGGDWHTISCVGFPARSRIVVHDGPRSSIGDLGDLRDVS
jgi:hypothetical protein